MIYFLRFLIGELASYSTLKTEGEFFHFSGFNLLVLWGFGLFCGFGTNSAEQSWGSDSLVLSFPQRVKAGTGWRLHFRDGRAGLTDCR